MVKKVTIEEYDHLIEAIYQAGIDPRRWSNFLDQLSATLDRVWLCLHGHDLSKNFNTGILYSRYDSVEMDRFLEYYASLNPWIEGLGEIPVGEARKAETFLDRSTLLKSEFYNDWVRPQEDIGTGGGIVLLREEDRMLAVSGNIRLKDPEDVQDQLIDVLTMLGPHIQRAFTMQRLIGSHQASAKGFATALDALPNAVLLLDGKGRVVHCNAAAEDMLSVGVLLRRGSGHSLFLCDPQAQAVLERQLRKIVDRLEPETRPIIFMEPHRGNPRLATLTPFTPDDERTDFFSGLIAPVSPVAILSFAPDRINDADLGRVLTAHYHLTPAEIRLASAMRNGTSVSDYASSNDLRVDTVRTHLKTIFSKTDTHRQGELVALLNKIA